MVQVCSPSVVVPRFGSGRAVSQMCHAFAAVELRDTDLSAVRWLEQVDVDWILLISSLAVEHTRTVVKPVKPLQLVPFSLLWNPRNSQNSAIAPFVQTSLAGDPPPGWFIPPGHSQARELGQ